VPQPSATDQTRRTDGALTLAGYLKKGGRAVDFNLGDHPDPSPHRSCMLAVALNRSIGCAEIMCFPNTKMLRPKSRVYFGEGLIPGEGFPTG